MQHSVVIVGGGPTGMMLAAELALAGVDSVIVERRTSRDLAGSRAGGLQSRTIEVLDQRGVAERFLSQGKTHNGAHFHVPLDMSDFPTRHNYLLALWQTHFERILAGWVAELGVPTLPGRGVTSFTQDDTGVHVTLSDGQTLRAKYVVGCDGGRSVMRKTAGIEFPGWDATMSWLIAEVHYSEEPTWGMRQDAAGIHGIGKLEDRGLARVVLTERQLVPSGQPTFEDIREALEAVFGSDFGIHSPAWISRFTDMTRQAAAYRERRLLLAGDAAHVHPPIGGQGLNIGVQDAVNLGWKLAQVIKGISPDSLLDTYHTERHPVAARALRNTMATVALRRTDDRTKALGEIASELFVLDEPRKRLVGRMSGLDVHYDLGRGHPLLGRRMPDLDLATPNGTTRVFNLLHPARPVLLKLRDGTVSSRVAEPSNVGGDNIAPWADRVQVVDAEYTGPWELPVLGAVVAPTGVLIRPDGHVAWVGERTDVGLTEALTTWFGEPIAA